jgi:hypothetical protein
MENLNNRPLEDQALVSPVKENSQPIVEQELKPKPKLNLFPFLTALLIIAAFLLGYFFNSNRQAPSISQDQIVDEDVVENLTTSPSPMISKPVEKVATEFLYTIDPNKDVAYDLEAWLLTLSGEKRKIDLPDFSVAYKYPDSSKVFFTPTVAPLQTDVRGMVYVKDLLTNEIKQYELANHRKPEVSESINIHTLNSIAPDGSMLVYNVYYFEPCPPITIEPGFEGGFGPCEPSPEPEYANGDYIYDFATQKSTPLGESIISSRWDLENNKFYFSTMEYKKNGLKVIDLKTKQISMVSASETFGYGGAPFFKSNIVAEIEGQTGDVSGQSSASIVSLFNLDTKESKVLDSGRWGDIQPFISISPEESKFIYIRSSLDSQNRAIYSLHYYDFTTGLLKKATPDSTISSYSIYGWWLDENTFVTSVNETGSNYDNGKNFLVKINLLTGQTTKLTDGNVYRFQQI